MNMQTTTRLTAAETALVEAFGAQVGDLPGNGAVTGTRDRLLDDLKKSGLPTRRIESWHYTDLKNLFRQVPDANGSANISAVAPLVEGSAVLSVLQARRMPRRRRKVFPCPSTRTRCPTAAPSRA